jgi:hypothetical protein
MTKLQKAREMLMKQLANIEEGKANDTEISNIINISDVLTKTYNTELRMKELEVRASETNFKLDGLDVFEDMQ